MPRCHYKIKELQAMTEHFKELPEYRGRVESYPVWSLVTLMLQPCSAMRRADKRIWPNWRGA